MEDPARGSRRQARKEPPTICSVRLSVRTPPFHGGKAGSIPAPSTNAPMAKSVAAPDLKSGVLWTCRFESGSGYHIEMYFC